MIGTIVKCANNLVIVFDRHGEQIPGYPGSIYGSKREYPQRRLARHGVRPSR